MIDVNDLRRGTTFILDGELYKVLEYQHYKPGRGNAIIRTKLRNLRTGATIQRNFLSGDRVQEIRIERRGVQYLYNDGDLYYFMDTETYDQMALSAAALEGRTGYLKEGMELVIAVYEGQPLEVELPTTVDLEVVETEAAVAGDTATSVTKKATLETGLEVQVPLFVQTGDVVRVDTRTGEYVTRV
ncbi:MAG TPA: elongation factor P [Anaerolineales bacterium]|nr:elongation factor P [Anaerolineae bacterium]HIP87625.1 elongation factor P [Anaerolineales bacterium]